MSQSLPPSGPPPGGPAAQPIPWENRDRLGIANAWVENLKLFVTSPAEGFARTARQGDFLSPLLWAIILGVAVSIVNWFWSFVFTAPMLPMLGSDERLAPFAAMMGGGFFQVILAPFLVAIGLFIGAAIFHVALMLVSGLDRSRAGFEGTFRALSYSYTAQIASVIPFVGGLISLVWTIVLLVIGFERLHDTSQGRAIAAAVLPVLVCCVCVGIGVAVGVAGLAGALGHMNQ